MPHSVKEPIVLASTSRYRARLLTRLRLPFSTIAPEVDEAALPGETGPQLAERLAILKAKAAGADAATYIGSDQVAVCDGVILGKPGTKARACAQLAQCSGKTTTFYTGVAVWQPHTGRLLCETLPYQVLMRQLSPQEIADYVDLDEPLDCAGSFKWESLGITLFDSMHGEDPTALEGLPLITLGRMLRACGYTLPPRPQSAADTL